MPNLWQQTTILIKYGTQNSIYTSTKWCNVEVLQNVQP